MIKIFILDNKKRLLKLAYSINDHTIPNNICIDEINAINETRHFTWKLTASSNVTDSGNTAQNIKQFDFDLQYEFNTNFNNIGLYCLTGKKNKIISKFEFYLQELSQNSIDKANDIVKKFCRDNNFLKHKTKFHLKLLNKFLNEHKYQAIIMTHDPNNLNNKISNTIYTKTYPNNTKFSNDLICTYIKEIMQKENFIPI